MESLWKFHGENPRLEYGETVEHLWRIANVEHLCRLDTLENYRLENTKTRYNGKVRETDWKGGKMFRKIVDWMNTPEGREVLTGIIFGAVGIFAVRIFCFLVCLATGYPANVWNIF